MLGFKKLYRYSWIFMSERIINSLEKNLNIIFEIDNCPPSLY